MSKAKGGRTERELIKMFFDTGVYAALRVAGSGSTPLPAPDLLVGGKGRVLAIECKSGKKRRYIQPEQIRELKEFAAKFGAEAWVAARFDREGWYFLNIADLHVSKGGNYAVDVEIAKEKGVSFEQLVKG